MRAAQKDEKWPVEPEKVIVFEHIKYKGRKCGFFIDDYEPKIIFEINCNPEWIEAYENYKKEQKKQDEEPEQST